MDCNLACCPSTTQCNWGGGSHPLSRGWSRLAADRVTYSGIGYLQPLRHPLGILPPIMTLCLLWENLSCTRSKRLKDSRNKNQLYFVLGLHNLHPFISKHTGLSCKLGLSHLTKVVEGATRTLCSAIGEYRTFGVLGCEKDVSSVLR